MARRPKRSKGVNISGQATEPAAPPWAPYRDGATRDEQHIEFADGSRVYQSIWRDGHQITDFVLVQQVKIRGKWRDVVKVDCCHGTAHVHQHTEGGRNDTRDLHSIASPADVQIGLKLATDLVYDHWRNNLRRWQRGK